MPHLALHLTELLSFAIDFRTLVVLPDLILERVTLMTGGDIGIRKIIGTPVFTGFGLSTYGGQSMSIFHQTVAHFIIVPFAI